MTGYRFDRLKILVVDDNAHMRKLVVAILQAFGTVQLFEAESGERAWTLLRECNPDMVVLDWMMEGMSGLELVKMIRTNPQTPNPFVPVIMLTGYTQIEHVRQARDAGVNEFIAKPVSVKTMMSRLIAVIENPRPYVRTKVYFGPCRRRRGDNEYRGPERRRGKIRGSGGIGAAMARQQPIELFMPPNMLKAKVGGTFSGPDLAAIKRAESAMEALKGEFAGWAEDDVRKLTAARERFAKTRDAKSRAGLLRAAHDMKGQAATFDYPLIARVAGSLSHLIHDLPEKAELPLSLVDAHVSAIHVIYRDKVMDMSNKVALKLAGELEARVTEALG